MGCRGRARVRRARPRVRGRSSAHRKVRCVADDELGQNMEREALAQGAPAKRVPKGICSLSCLFELLEGHQFGRNVRPTSAETAGNVRRSRNLMSRVVPAHSCTIAVF